MAYLDPSHNWSLFVQRDGSFMIYHPIGAMSTTFITSNLVLSPIDCCLPLSDFVFQYTSFDDTLQTIKAIEDDFLNSLASIHKYFVLLSYANRHRSAHPYTLVSTELEFAFGNHRSFYDLLIKLFTSLYKKLKLQKDGKPISPASLTESFDRILGKTDEYLAESYHFAPSIISYLRKRESVFKALRQVRNNVNHKGHSLDRIYATEEGFALSLDDREWSQLRTFGIWPEKSVKNNRIASILGLLVFIADDIEAAMAGLADAIKELFVTTCGGVPQRISEGHRMCLRDDLVSHFIRLPEYRQNLWISSNDPLESLHKEWEAVHQPTNIQG